MDRSKTYPLQEIVFLANFAALQGIESWRGIELLGDKHLDFLRRFYLFKEGIPSHQTIGRFFSILKPQSFEAFFMAWSATLSGPSAGKQIAIDGKTSRGSYDTASGKQAIHLLNACAVESGIVLEQLEVGAATNEITAVPEMIDALDLAGAIISGDALITQKDIAAKIIDAKADYNLALKGKHKNLHDEVKYQFDTRKISTASSNYFSETEKSHGRVHERTYETIDVDDKIFPQFSEWKGLKSIGRVSTVVWKQDKETVETRYYLLSYKGAENSPKALRATGLWSPCTGFLMSLLEKTPQENEKFMPLGTIPLLESSL